jgi:hypothetical protein
LSPSLLLDPLLRAACVAVLLLLRLLDEHPNLLLPLLKDLCCSGNTWLLILPLRRDAGMHGPAAAGSRACRTTHDLLLLLLLLLLRRAGSMQCWGLAGQHLLAAWRRMVAGCGCCSCMPRQGILPKLPEEVTCG